MLSCLVETTLQAQSTDAIIEKLKYISSVKGYPQPLIQRLQEGATASQIFSSPRVREELSAVLSVYGLKPLAPTTLGFDDVDDDIPF